MRKLLLIIISLFTIAVSCNVSFAREFLPDNIHSTPDWGVGVYLASEKVCLYDSPNKNAKILDVILRNEIQATNISEELSSKNIFLAFIPKIDIAAMPVIDETDDYYQVIYDNERNQKGWIKKSNEDQFYTWQEFFNVFARKYGLVILKDIPDKYKKIRTDNSDDSPVIDNKYYWPESVILKLIQGNWMLIKIIDYDKETTAIGWIRWRDEEGNLFVFPDFNSITNRPAG